MLFEQASTHTRLFPLTPVMLFSAVESTLQLDFLLYGKWVLMEPDIKLLG